MSSGALRLAIVATHPVQYNAPAFRELAAREGLDLRVFYSMESATVGGFDSGFGREVHWDVPLLEGYEYEFGDNRAKKASVSTFSGVHDPSLCRRVERWRPDAVLVYGWSNRAHLGAMRYFSSRCAVLFRGDSTLLDETPGWRKVARRVWLRWVYSHVDIALAVGTCSREYFLAMGLNEDQIVIAPHAVDNSRFRAHALRHEEAAVVRRRECLIPDESVVFVFPGKLEQKKGPDLLLEAFGSLPSSCNAHLVFIGSGPLEKELVARAGRRVHFLGFQNQSVMPTAYRIGDLVVLPSRGPGETWGLAINEAMACGRAVAASDRVGCAVDLVEPGRNGWRFEAGDRVAITQVLLEAAADGRDGLRTKGRASADLIEEWSIASQADAIHGALMSLRDRG
ncbi:glycosyltransferase family 4 protein [bacterium]|nr:glycosyltransferase family 4 protein [bacterium]